jgi:hypothetical protein
MRLHLSRLYSHMFSLRATCVRTKSILVIICCRKYSRVLSWGGQDTFSFFADEGWSRSISYGLALVTRSSTSVLSIRISYGSIPNGSITRNSASWSKWGSHLYMVDVLSIYSNYMNLSSSYLRYHSMAFLSVRQGIFDGSDLMRVEFSSFIDDILSSLISKSSSGLV